MAKADEKLLKFLQESPKPVREALVDYLLNNSDHKYDFSEVSEEDLESLYQNMGGEQAEPSALKEALVEEMWKRMIAEQRAERARDAAQEISKQDLDAIRKIPEKPNQPQDSSDMVPEESSVKKDDQLLKHYWENNPDECRSDNLNETDAFEKAYARINDAAQHLIENDCAALRQIKRLKDWHNADYTLYTARELNAITNEQYHQAVSIFCEWWEKITRQSVIRALTDLQLSEITGMSEEDRCKREAEEERFRELGARQAELVKRYQDGDRSDELFEEFEAVHSKITFSGAIIDYTEEFSRVLCEILHEVAERKRKKLLRQNS